MKVELVPYVLFCVSILGIIVVFALAILLAQIYIPNNPTLSEIEPFSTMPLATLGRLILAHQLQWFSTGAVFAYFIYKIQRLRTKQDSN